MRARASIDTPFGFTRIETIRREFVLRNDLVPMAAEIWARIEALADARERGVGNRASAYHLTLAGGPDIFVRRSLRGGAMRFVGSDLHFGKRPRPLEELRTTLEARARGIEAVEPLGAIVDWSGRLAYRGYFITRAVAGMTMWDFLRTDDDPTVRIHVARQVRLAIGTMHDRGVRHADLNLNNIIVTPSGEEFRIVLLDFDKARLYSRPVPALSRRRNLSRLARSAHKLDPEGKTVGPDLLSVLTAV
jgi:3-deoxy-D-manno-octulosonic acid kinase